VVLHQTSRAGGDGTRPLGFKAGKGSGTIEEDSDYV
jgi:hypothetical protein